MFRRQTIVDRCRHAADSRDQLLHEPVVLLDISHHVSAAMNPEQGRKLARLMIWPVDADPHGRVALQSRRELILAGYTLDRGQALQHRGHHFFHLGPGCRNLIEIQRAVSRQLLHHNSKLRV